MNKYLNRPTNRRVYENSEGQVYAGSQEGNYQGDITISDNHIYLYADITPKSVMEVGIAIRSVGQQIVNLMTD